jgi:hypothetical protein
VEGLEFFGPFESGNAAAEWADLGVNDAYWVAKLQPPGYKLVTRHVNTALEAGKLAVRLIANGVWFECVRLTPITFGDEVYEFTAQDKEDLPDKEQWKT